MLPFRTAIIARYTMAASCAAFLALGAVSAQAQDIYLNGVDITRSQLRNLTLERVDKVEFDAKGDIYITAPGYGVRVEPVSTPEATPRSTQRPTAPAAPARTPALDQKDQSQPVVVHYQAEVSMSHRYMLTLANPDRGTVPFDVDVLINGKHAATYKHTRGNATLDVSEHVKRGENTVTFIARRVAGAQTSPGHEMKIVLGVGSYDGRVTQYDHILLGMDYKSGDARSDVRNSLKFTVQ